MTPLVLNIYGTPRAQPRPRFVNGRVVSTGDPKAKRWRAGVEKAIREAVANRAGTTPLFDGPVRVRMVFTFVPVATKLARLDTPHTQKPDADNLAKPILDLLERVGVYRNDSQVAQAPPEKWWGDRAGVTVTVESMSGERREAAPQNLTVPPDWLTEAIRRRVR